MFISWTPSNNGLPHSCRLLVPSVGSTFSLSFKTKGRGWVELACKKATNPHYEVDFEMRIDPVFEGDSNHRKGDATTIQFILVDKEGQTLKRLGESFLDVIVRSTKNHNKTLTGKIIYDQDADRPIPSKDNASSSSSSSHVVSHKPIEHVSRQETAAIDLVPYYQKHVVPLDKQKQTKQHVDYQKSQKPLQQPQQSVQTSSRPQQPHHQQQQQQVPASSPLASQLKPMPQNSFSFSSTGHFNSSNILPPFGAVPLNEERHAMDRTRGLASIGNLMNETRDNRTNIKNLLQPDDHVNTPMDTSRTWERNDTRISHTFHSSILG